MRTELWTGSDLPQYRSWHVEFGCSAFTTVTTPSILLHNTGRSDTMTGQQSIFSTLSLLFKTVTKRLSLHAATGPSPCLNDWEEPGLVSLSSCLKTKIKNTPETSLVQMAIQKSSTPFCCSNFLRFLPLESGIRLPGVSVSLARSVLASSKHLQHIYFTFMHLCCLSSSSSTSESVGLL